MAVTSTVSPLVCAVTHFSLDFPLASGRGLLLFSPKEEPVEIILTLILAPPHPHLALRGPFSMK